MLVMPQGPGLLDNSKGIDLGIYGTDMSLPVVGVLFVFRGARGSRWIWPLRMLKPNLRCRTTGSLVSLFAAHKDTIRHYDVT